MSRFTNEQRIKACEEILSGRTAASIGREIGATALVVLRWARRYRRGEPFDRRRSNGRKPVLGDADMQLVEQWVAAEPYRAASSICEALAGLHGHPVTPAMLRSAMKKHGIRFVRPVRSSAERVPVEQQTRYRPEHRREPVGEHYTSSLTEAEWAVLQPLFIEAAAGRGRPFSTDPRETLDAIFYVLRSGCAWRLLPAHYPSWKSVYTDFRAWSRSGRMDRVYGTLLEMWRGRIGRGPQPTATIIDSQTIKTTEKGGPEVTMEPRRSKDESATSP